MHSKCTPLFLYGQSQFSSRNPKTDGVEQLEKQQRGQEKAALVQMFRLWFLTIYHWKRKQHMCHSVWPLQLT